MALTISQVGITGTATLLATIPADATVVLLASSASAFGLSSSVTTTSGFTLPANVPVTFRLGDYSSTTSYTLYGITASSANVSVLITT